MIEKMKFLSITGPKADIDRVVDTYLSRYEIHLENALSELKTVKDLRPYIETNPYKEKLNIARELAEKIGGQLPEVSETELPTQEEAAKMVDDLNSRLKELNDKKEELQAQIQTLKRSKDQVAPFTELNYSVKEILGFQFIKFRFGLEDGHPRTLEEVGREFGVTRERIRQIENKAIRKLRHPSRAKKIKDFYC